MEGGGGEGKTGKKREGRKKGGRLGKPGAGWGLGRERRSAAVKECGPPRTRASPKSRKIMLMKTNGAHKGSLSPASGGAAGGACVCPSYRWAWGAAAE